MSLPLAGGQGVNAGADVAEKEEKRGQEGQARKATHRRAARKGHTLERTFGNRKPGGQAGHVGHKRPCDPWTHFMVGHALTTRRLLRTQEVPDEVKP